MKLSQGLAHGLLAAGSTLPAHGQDITGWAAIGYKLRAVSTLDGCAA